MKTMMKKSMAVAVFVGAFGVLPGQASAQVVDVYLAAGQFEMPINGESIPMWGYMEILPGANDCNLLGVTNNPALQVPGPEIVASAGETLNIHLLNCLPEPNNAAAEGMTSVMIPGQVLPTGSAPAFYGAGEFSGRMRSQVPEAAPDATLLTTYTYTDLKEGTYIYHSGTHMQVQVQMGLHGPLTVCPGNYRESQSRCIGPNKAYAGAKRGVYREAALFYSEVDPTLHVAVANAQYGPGRPVTSTVNYKPEYLLINGVPFDGSKLNLQDALGLGENNRRVLVRVRSAGSKYHMIACKFCNDARAIAEDGHLYTYFRPGDAAAPTVFERRQETFLVAPLQTRDLTVLNVDPDGAGTVTSRMLQLDVDRFGVIPPVTQ